MLQPIIRGRWRCFDFTFGELSCCPSSYMHSVVSDPLPPQQRHQLTQVIWHHLVARDVFNSLLVAVAPHQRYLNTAWPDLIHSEIIHMICHNRTGPVLNPDESWSYNTKPEPVRIPGWVSALLKLVNPLRTLLCINHCWTPMPLHSGHVLWTELWKSINKCNNRQKNRDKKRYSTWGYKTSVWSGKLDKKIQE